MIRLRRKDVVAAEALHVLRMMMTAVVKMGKAVLELQMLMKMKKAVPHWPICPILV